MKPETITIIRKSAREATIFALVGMVVAAIGAFVYMDNKDRTNAKEKAAEAVHAGPDLNIYHGSQPLPTITVPLKNGTFLHVRMCVMSTRLLQACITQPIVQNSLMALRGLLVFAFLFR